MRRPYLYSATRSYPTLGLRARGFGCGKHPLSRKRSVSYFIRITAPSTEGVITLERRRIWRRRRGITEEEERRGEERRGEEKEAFVRHK